MRITIRQKWPVPRLAFTRQMAQTRLYSSEEVPPPEAPAAATKNDVGAGNASKVSRQPITSKIQPRPDSIKYKRALWPRRLSGHRAIVTGGSRGIGWSIASRMAMEGIACTLVGRDEKVLKKAVEALPPVRTGKSLHFRLAAEGSNAGTASEGEAGEAAVADDAKEQESEPAQPIEPAQSIESTEAMQHSYFVGDVRRADMWASLFREHPNVNYLVNAAGITHNAVLSRLPPSDIEAVLDVNLLGTTLGCRIALRTWMKNRSADRCIVNISSLLATRGGFGAAAYAASKAGVVGLTRVVAEEGASRRVRANVVLPGYINSDMTAGLHLNETIQRIPAKRLGRTDEVADAVVFLLKNEYANNCVLNLDGGLSALS